VVIIIELTDDQASAEDVEHEIERVMGVDVVVVMIEKGKFEVTVVGGDAIDATDLAKKLETAKRDGTSDLLRHIKTVTLRIDALSGARDAHGGGLQQIIAAVTIFAATIVTQA
jgi:metal-responsive CopG/Arc/MetJ family transcriptional regulator